MARNHYTQQVHKLEQAQKERRERELTRLAGKLRDPEKQPTEVSPFNDDKVRRSTRLAHNRRHKARHKNKK